MEITVSRLVASDPDTVWAHLTDLDHMGELSPENVSSTWQGADRGPGATFKGRNRIGFLRWSTVATVTAWEPGRRFAFETSPPSRSTWTYDLEAADGGTRVTESVTKADEQPLPIRLLQRLVGVRTARPTCAPAWRPRSSGWTARSRPRPARAGAADAQLTAG